MVIQLNPKPTENRSPVVLPYDQDWPKLAAEPVYAGERAAVLGQASLGEGAWLGDRSVIRADGHHVRIGRNFHLGPRGTVHIFHDLYPAIIGNDVSAGENAVIHACEIGDQCVLGHGTTVLDGSVVEPRTILAPASVVYPRSTLEGGWLYSGCPAKPVRAVSPEELDREHAHVRSSPSTAGQPGTERQWSFESDAGSSASDNLFVACTAELAGEICAEADASIWYGCRLDAGRKRIMIGARTNIQDNTIIACHEEDVVIGENVTVGHNASLTDCTVGVNSLIGISAVLSRGAVVEDDVLLAAGAQTLPGQRLESGWMWAGRPARRIAPLNPAKRAMMAQTIPVYCLYANRFGQAQKTARQFGATRD